MAKPQLSEVVQNRQNTEPLSTLEISQGQEVRTNTELAGYYLLGERNSYGIAVPISDGLYTTSAEIRGKQKTSETDFTSGLTEWANRGLSENPEKKRALAIVFHDIEGVTDAKGNFVFEKDQAERVLRQYFQQDPPENNLRIEAFTKRIVDAVTPQGNLAEAQKMFAQVAPLMNMWGDPRFIQDAEECIKAQCVAVRGEVEEYQKQHFPNGQAPELGLSENPRLNWTLFGVENLNKNTLSKALELAKSKQKNKEITLENLTRYPIAQNFIDLGYIPATTNINQLQKLVTALRELGLLQDSQIPKVMSLDNKVKTSQDKSMSQLPEGAASSVVYPEENPWEDIAANMEAAQGIDKKVQANTLGESGHTGPLENSEFAPPGDEHLPSSTDTQPLQNVMAESASRGSELHAVQSIMPSETRSPAEAYREHIRQAAEEKRVRETGASEMVQALSIAVLSKIEYKIQKRASKYENRKQKAKDRGEKAWQEATAAFDKAHKVEGLQDELKIVNAAKAEVRNRLTWEGSKDLGFFGRRQLESGGIRERMKIFLEKKFYNHYINQQRRAERRAKRHETKAWVWDKFLSATIRGQEELRNRLNPNPVEPPAEIAA